jgi:Na+-translocating ferredoxin:NAD+ oxidoreductase RNF subunit RnfB
MDSTLIIALATMGGLGFIFAGGLAFADKKLRVEENPLIAKVNELLPNANCGACGNAGCYDFAVKVVEGKLAPTSCPVCDEEAAAEIAKLTGGDGVNAIKLLPRILCGGGDGKAKNKDVHYKGPSKCALTDIVAGGDKKCSYGCLGGGDCVEACKFNAIYIGNDKLPVVIEELCKGCGLCAQACPRGIIEMHPAERDLFVYCKSHDDPKTSKENCSAACIGCGICARNSNGAVEIIDNLAVINYELLNPGEIPIEKCSTRAIKKIEKNKITVSLN